MIFLILFITTVNGACSPTNSDVEGPFYEAGARRTRQLAPPAELNNKQIATILSGQVVDRDCKPISNARVDVWYAGDQKTSANPNGQVHYTFPPDVLWYRGWTLTDQSGGYSFQATYPGVYTSRPIPHYHVKVQTKTKSFTTQIYFQDDVPPSFEDYVRGRSSQFPNVSFNRDGSRNVVFNIVLQN